MANGETKSFRERTIEKNVRWATVNKLNQEAINYAQKYVNMNPATLTLVSNFFDALDNNDDSALRNAIDGVFRYIRTLPKVEDSDHRDLNEFNNSWSNLREATDSEQTAHRRNWRTGKLKWTYLDAKTGLYKSQVQFAGKVHYLGSYSTELDAHNAAYAVAQQLHGSFVRR